MSDDNAKASEMRHVAARPLPPVPVAGAGAAERTVECFENQRFYPLAGYTSRLLWTDRPSWSNADGTARATKESEAQLPSNLWRWISEWEVDMNNADKKGWRYAVDFPSRHWSGKKTVAHFVRRRRWVRKMVGRDLLAEVRGEDGGGAAAAQQDGDANDNEENPAAGGDAGAAEAGKAKDKGDKEDEGGEEDDDELVRPELDRQASALFKAVQNGTLTKDELAKVLALAAKDTSSTPQSDPKGDAAEAKAGDNGDGEQKAMPELTRKESTDGLCRVCLDNKCEAVIIPCGHYVLCMECADLITKGENVCPICRKPCERIVRIFEA